MSGRSHYSRPRTRVYDANYNIGQNYYKSALDSIDRKYSGRPLSPLRKTEIPQNLLERHERAFADEDLETSRRRAEKHITERHLFDSRGGRIAEDLLNGFDNDIDEEAASALSRIRANRKVTSIDDVDLDGTMSSIKSNRLLKKTEKLLDVVGINESSRRALDEDVFNKKRNLKVSFEKDANQLTKWTPLLKEDDRESAAVLRAKQSRERIQNIDDEMAELAERQATRERRSARLKAIVAESSQETEAAQAALQSVRISKRREVQTAEY